ncbi:MAG: ATP-binding protein [Calditrichae bacterium]|nr:ATP-binding protein [Calditrichota bacterium]MCB9057449.1 ATP-binding protein [Calditrichia bacterium]
MINRELINLVEKNLFKNKAIIILGARQTGKTTLLKYFYDKFKNETLFLDCDETIVREQLQDASSQKLRRLLGNAKVIFIDEAQRVKNIGLSLKIIKDQIPEKQLIVSGSSSLDLANEINEPLTGRKFEYYLYPISFGELVAHKNLITIQSDLEQRMIYGMYPDIINNVGDEIALLKNLAGSYLYKDLLSYKEIRKPALLEKLLQALALQIGNEVSFSELAGLLQIDKQTIEKYVYLLEQAFIIFRLAPLSRNLRNELSKMRKIYFWDTGIRNALISNFNPINLRNDAGALWENFLISERLKKNHYHEKYGNYFFWRTHQQQEIDFIEEYDGKMHAFEFKWNPKAKVRFPKTFLDAYPEHETAIVHRDNYVDFLMED